LVFQIFRNYQISRKSAHVAADLFHAHRLTDDRRTEMTNPIVAFRNFAFELKNYKLHLVSY